MYSTFLGVLIQARWLNSESVETPITWQSMLAKSLALSLNAISSVGQTNVLKQIRYLSKWIEATKLYLAANHHNKALCLCFVLIFNVGVYKTVKFYFVQVPSYY